MPAGLGLTAVLHTLIQYRRSGRYAVLAPAATAALLPLVIYATTVVRSGVFRSVHSLAGGGIGSGVLFLLGTTSTLAVGPAFIHWYRTDRDAEAASLFDGGDNRPLRARVHPACVRLALRPHVPRGSQPRFRSRICVGASPSLFRSSSGASLSEADAQ
ncbi:hypothetical protein C8039_07255 [Halogeometricum sp. wsp3]|nr:hypothetical protein C8039_07255 [Halogeometricum sp. wsp3]